MPIPISRHQHVRTERTWRMALDNNDLHRLLAAAGHDIPADAHIYFSVPGGADWSSTDIDIEPSHPIHIVWSTTDETSL